MDSDVVRFRSGWSVVNRNRWSQERVVACESSCDVPSCERMISDSLKGLSCLKGVS